MFPSEMVILVAVAANCYSQERVKKWMDMEGEYIGYLCDSLAKRSYLKKRTLGKYQLTSFGREALLNYLRNSKHTQEDIAIKLRILGIGIGQRQEQAINKLHKEVVSLSR